VRWQLQTAVLVSDKARIDFVFFDAGGGHRAAASALSEVIARQNRPWEIRLVNLQEVLDPLDVFRKITRVRLQDLYNLILKKGWTLGSAQILKVIHAVIRLYHPAQVRLLERHWRGDPPRMVVSLVPNFNRAMFEALAQACPDAPYVTILTDLADWPPHFWMERQDQWLICGTPEAVRQARSLGHRPQRILEASGMILSPRFYVPAVLDRACERERLGLTPHLPTGIVMFGGQGSSVMIPIADRLEKAGLDIQLILICGKNRKLAERLRRRNSRMPRFVEGFTREVPYYMRLSDFFIGKPGPGSISEAAAMGLPAIVERNAWTLPQERYNAEWISENKVGLVLNNFTEIAVAVRALLTGGLLERYRANASAMHNQAVFEIPDMLERILATGP
jgi:1,2-diacylglycerol 3-beta-galactosyltransferase